MDVGTINETRTSYDIDSVAETDSVIVQSDTNGVIKTRWMHKNEKDELVIHERSLMRGNIATKGSSLVISEVPGYACEGDGGSGRVGRLAADIDFDSPAGFTTKEVVHQGEVYTAVLAPVALR